MEMQSDHELPLGFPAWMRKRATRAQCLALGGCAAVPIICAAPAAYAAFGVPVLVPGPAPAATPAGISSITSVFSPDRLGARGAMTFSIHYAVGQTDGVSPAGPRVPAPVRKLTMRFPAGMGLEIPNLRGCSAARLRAHGTRGCPAAARVGGGYALTALPAGSQIIT